MGLTYVQKWNKAGSYLIQLCSILCIGIVYMLELTAGVHIVAGINPDLLAYRGCSIGHGGIVMDISAKRNLTSARTQAGADIGHVLCLSLSLSGESDQLAAGFSYS